MTGCDRLRPLADRLVPVGPDLPTPADNSVVHEFGDLGHRGVMRPSVIAFDVNETLSDLSPLGARFLEVGASASAAPLWFASVLRDGFAQILYDDQLLSLIHI